jgi:hypothetical protein
MKFVEQMFAAGLTPTCSAVADRMIKDLSIPKSFRWQREIDRQRAVLFAHDGARSLAGAAIRATSNKSTPRPEDVDQLMLEYGVQALYVIKDENGDEIIVKTKDEVASEYGDRRLRLKVAELFAAGQGVIDGAERLQRYLDRLFPRPLLVAAE